MHLALLALAFGLWSVLCVAIGVLLSRRHIAVTSDIYVDLLRENRGLREELRTKGRK
jgi:Na+(H+)/acetate symporter ActP